jgi:ribosome-binding protein aMBF1 (putative translation factor)
VIASGTALPRKAKCAATSNAVTRMLPHVKLRQAVDRQVPWCDNLCIMTRTKTMNTITSILRRAIGESGMSYKALSRETGVARASIQRFVDGRQSLRLDMAEKLADYLGFELRKKK